MSYISKHKSFLFIWNRLELQTLKRNQIQLIPIDLNALKNFLCLMNSNKPFPPHNLHYHLFLTTTSCCTVTSLYFFNQVDLG